jgi:hypothetical protein
MDMFTKSLPSTGRTARENTANTPSNPNHDRFFFLNKSGSAPPRSSGRMRLSMSMRFHASACFACATWCRTLFASHASWPASTSGDRPASNRTSHACPRFDVVELSCAVSTSPDSLAKAMV